MYVTRFTQIGLSTHFSLNWRQLGVGYLKMALYCIAGNLAPFVLLLLLSGVCMLISSDLMLELVDVRTQGVITKAIATFTSKHELNIIVVTSAIAFILGFGGAALSLRKMMRSIGSNLCEALSLNLNSLKGSWTKAFGLAFGCFLLSMGVESVMKWALPLPTQTDKAADLIGMLSWTHLLLMVPLATLAAPFFEEIIFRGFAYGGVRATLHNRAGLSETKAHWIASLFSSALFAVVHYNNITGTLVIFTLSLLMAELYRRSGSLWCPIITHMLNNSLAVALIFLPH